MNEWSFETEEYTYYIILSINTYRIIGVSMQVSMQVSMEISRHTNTGRLGRQGCVPPVGPSHFGTLLRSIGDLMQRKGRLMHACLEKAYNFGFSRGEPRRPPDR